MKGRFFLALICSLPVMAETVTIPPQGVQPARRIELLSETVVDNLASPYGLYFDSTDLLVTTETDLVKLKLSEQIEGEALEVEVIEALAGGNALGLIKHGNDLVVMECTPGCTSNRLYIRRPDGDEITLMTTSNEIVEVRAYRNQFIVSDITAGKLLLVDSEGNVSDFTTDKLNGPAGLYVDGDYVWVTNFFTGELLRINAAGQATVIATGLGMPVGVQYDGKDFIVADFAAGEPGQGRVLRVAKDGRVRVIADGDFIGNPSAIALQGSDIYVSDILSSKIIKIHTPRLYSLPCKAGAAPRPCRVKLSDLPQQSGLQ